MNKLLIQELRIRNLLVYNLISIFIGILGMILLGWMLIPYFPMIAFNYLQSICFVYPLLMLFFIFNKIHRLGIKKKDFIGSLPKKNKVWLEVLSVIIVVAFLFFIARDVRIRMLTILSFSYGFLGKDKILLVFFMLLYTAVIEMQRAIIIQRITNKWNVWIAIVLSTIPFVLAGEYLVDSLIFSLLYIKTRSIIVPFIANYFLFMLTILTNVRFNIYSQSTTILQNKLLFFILFLLCLVYYFYCNWPSKDWGKVEKDEIGSK